MDPTGGSTVVTVADVDGFTIDMKKDREDVTAFGDTNKQKVTGLPDYSGNITGLWNSVTSPVMFDAILGSVAVFLHLIPDTGAPTFLFKGLANLDGSLTVNAKGAVRYSCTWDAAGNWLMEP
jgi:hypothetical protein